MVHHRRCTFVAVALTMVVAVSAVAPVSAAPALYRSLWGVAPIEATVANSSTMPFADPAFESLWNRTDALVARGRVKRGFYWGPAPYSGALSEEAEGSPGGKHLVQYFDKGRMEINNPNGDKSSPFYVTSGLLVREMAEGRYQTGAYRTRDLWRAEIPVAGDLDDVTAPTYASFREIITLAPSNRSVPGHAIQAGEIITATINRAGLRGYDSGLAHYGVVMTLHAFPASSYTDPSIANVFWDFLNAGGPILQAGKSITAPLSNPYFGMTGVPISHPYWAKAKIAGRPNVDVLIQLFERRTLTYVPSAPVGFKVQMGNAGLHYFGWRYLSMGKPGTPTCPDLPSGAIGALWSSHPDLQRNLGCLLSYKEKLGPFQKTEHGYLLDLVRDYEGIGGGIIPQRSTLALLDGGAAGVLNVNNPQCEGCLGVPPAGLLLPDPTFLSAWSSLQDYPPKGTDAPRWRDRLGWAVSPPTAIGALPYEAFESGLVFTGPDGSLFAVYKEGGDLSASAGGDVDRVTRWAAYARNVP